MNALRSEYLYALISLKYYSLIVIRDCGVLCADQCSILYLFALESTRNIMSLIIVLFGIICKSNNPTAPLRAE